MKNDIYMIGALDCYGVPYTPDNLNHESYIDMTALELKSQGVNLTYVNMHSIAFNKTWELEKLLNKNYTKGQYYYLNKRLSEKVIKSSNRFGHPVHPDFLDSYYSNVQDPNLEITTSLINSKEVIFIYSCGGMNLDYYLKCFTLDLKQIIPQLLFHLKENLNKTFQDIEKTLIYLNSLNRNIKIYVLSVYPMIEQKTLRYLLQDFYKIYNNELRKICNKHPNLYYVDIFQNIENVAKHDNHPNYKGQCYIKQKVLKSIYENQ